MKILLPAALLLSAITAYPIDREEALDFLYSAMSLPDKADYPEEFYIDNIEASLLARKEMPWGESVPEREFLHFVLPVRVNNENLDYSRLAFYDALKDRVKNLSMKDAILEVNHWCHEHVTYKPSDARTSSPMSSVSQAIGRCGEESTFTVAALRSVGIPARQIYTPRWAHTDDNHAWVEAWADGEWHFLGACEPEPVLDLAWFNDPASRGLLMSTNVAGDYQGPEEVLLKQPLTTRINVTSNYAPVATLPVEVVYSDGKPATDADVNFCIYNYAEFYPAVTKKSDNYGKASLTAGLGDIVVWATDGKRFGFAKGNPKDFSNSTSNHDVLKIVLDKDASFQGSFDFDLIPPPAGAPLPAVTEKQRAINDMRMAQEDSIRNAYTATFATPAQAAEYAVKLGVDKDYLTKILVESRGNHAKIIRCLESLPSDKRETAIALLMNVSEKDRRDIPEEVIADHVKYTDSGKGDDFHNKYVLNPRIENEFLTPWRSILTYRQKGFSDKELTGSKSNPEKLVEWVASYVTPAGNENPQNLRMSPGAVLKEKKADPVSRNIFFVALARSLNIPARIDPVTGATQYADANQKWINADFSKYENNDKTASCEASQTKGTLTLTFNPEGYITDPKYYSQFSLSRIINGKPRLLEFDEEGTLSSLFSSPVELESGQYILTSGQRLANGGVLAHSNIFTITPGENVSLPLDIRQDKSSVSVIGSVNAENIYHDLASGADKSLLSTTGRGYYILGIISPNHEPSTHALNDLSVVAERLDNTGHKIMLLFDNSDKASRFNAEAFPGLPKNVVFGIDNNGVSRNEILESLHLKNATDPIFVIADTFNRIVWVSTGYTIGIGETILSTLSAIEK